MNKPSNKGDQVRQKILKFLKQKQVVISPVSYKEIADEIETSSTSVVAHHLDIMERQGMIKRDGVRHIEVVK